MQRQSNLKARAFRLWALILCLCLYVVPPAQAAELDFRAAWGGVATQSAFTELTIGLRSAEPGVHTLIFPSADTRTEVQINAQAAQRVSVVVPYPVPGPGPVEWMLEKDGSVVATGQAQVFTRVARKPWNIDLAVSSEDPRTVNVLSAALPRIVQAYDSIRSIALTPRDLRNLTQDQTRALEGHMVRCGRVVLLDASPLLLERLKQLAGCGGRHVTTDRQSLLPPELPKARDLRGLTDCNDCGGALSRLTVLSTIFLCLLVVLSLLGRTNALIALGFAVTCALFVMYLRSDPYITWLSWSQADAGANAHVRRTLLIVEGRGRSDLSVPLPIGSIPELPLPNGAELEFTADGSGPSSTTLRLQTGYLTRDILSFVDTDPTPSRFQETADGPAHALARTIARKTKLTFALATRSDAVTRPAEGLHVQWHATVTAKRGAKD